jgi:hypothetical protein
MEGRYQARGGRTRQDGAGHTEGGGMTDNVLNFPGTEKVTCDTILTEAVDKLADCIILGVTKEGDAYYSICAQDVAQVVFLMRTLEHVLIEKEMTEQ